MKRACIFILIVALFFSMIPMAFAADNHATDSAVYIEATTGDTITVEAVPVSKNMAKRKNLSENTYATCIMRNGLMEEQLFVDFTNDILRHEYPDGSAIEEKLSDVVTIKSTSPSENDKIVGLFSPGSEERNTRIVNDYDYIDNEPLSVSASGTQEELTGAPVYSGYRAMGYRGGYFYAPTTYGYLQRYNAGVIGTYYSNLFSFSLGTTIGTAASIIVAAITNFNIAGLTLSIAVAILGMIIDTINHDWSVLFEVKTFKWSYRLRLNSNTGFIIYTSYRTQDHWKGYNPATGVASYNYRGAAYDTGFPLSNEEMIKFGIDSYLEGLINR